MSDPQPTGEIKSAIISDALYKCEQCGNYLPADKVWNASGKVVCKKCYAKSGASEPVTTASGKNVAPSEGNKSRQNPLGPLLANMTCPHCWHRFAPDHLLWVSQHAELMGDAVLGSDAASRFLPTRFTVDGNALDARGMRCQILACPRCHLIIPRSWIDTEPLFVSIVGVPASGKSYFLTAMTWELRRLLAEKFAIIFNDADTVSNRILNEYEEHLFLQSDPSRMVAIRKTEVHGVNLYDQIRLGQQVTSLPRPFLFTLRPGTGHPNVSQIKRFGRTLCLYDNAGEAFDPGEDSSASPVTQHLSKSRVLIFLYDPTQDARFRIKCRQVSHDPQLDGRSRRQETVFLEMAARIRRYSGLAEHKKHDRPMIVVVPKADVWGPLINLEIDTEPIAPRLYVNGAMASVDVERIKSTSARVRALLLESAPEFVAAVEDFVQHIIYIPVSSLGCSPQSNDNQEGLYVRAGDIRPRWVTAPLLFTFANWAKGLIGGVASSAHDQPVAQKTAPPNLV
jgi:hypothetical protein